MRILFLEPDNSTVNLTGAQLPSKKNQISKDNKLGEEGRTHGSKLFRSNLGFIPYSLESVWMGTEAPPT